jgi:hypothetical protein
MNITVTFTDSGDPDMPDGTAVVFENVEDWQLNTPVAVKEIDCAAAGCNGCGAVHRTLTGEARLELTASARESRPLWKLPAVT